MRQLSRLLAPILASAAIVLAGSTSALAAASPSNAKLDTSFCYQYGSSQFCYEIDGTIHYLDTTAGSSVTIEKTTRTTRYDSGEYVGEAMSVSFLHGEFRADGTVVTDTVTNTRSTLGDEPCSYRLVVRLIDYEAVVYETYSSCGA